MSAPKSYVSCFLSNLIYSAFGIRFKQMRAHTKTQEVIDDDVDGLI